MIKRVNFTGRRRIPRDRVSIEVHDGQPRRFDATIDLKDIPLEENAAVIIEAMCAGSSVIERFEFGEVGNILPPVNRELRQLEGKNVFFTLKVVDRTERVGRILGLAEHIRPEKAGTQTVAGRRGILPIEESDELGQELWKLEFQEHDVFLLVNRTVPGLADRFRSDPTVYAMVYPNVIREILARAIDQGVGDAQEEDDHWPTLWLRFGKSLLPSGEQPPKPDDDPADIEEWIDEVVDEFAKKHGLMEKYLASAAMATGDEQ